MTSRHVATVATAVIAVSALSNCLAPTEIVVELKTDLDCLVVAQNGVTIAFGKPGDDQNQIAAASSSCDAGSLGKIVVAPAHDFSDPLGIRVALGVTQKAEQCTPPKFDGCIVARRSLQYVPHTPLTLPIELDQDCLNQECDPHSTCSHGSCVDASVPSCPNNTCSLPDAGSGNCVNPPAVPIASDVRASTPRIAKAANGYIVAWLTGSTNQLMAKTVDANGADVASAVQVGAAGSTTKLTGVSTDGSNYVVLREANSQLELTFVDFAGGITGSPAWGISVGPLAGLFYESQGNRFVTVGIVSGSTEMLIAMLGSAPTFDAPLTTMPVTDVALARGGGKYYATMHDAAACYAATCTPNGTGFICGSPVTTSSCTGIRMAANATDTLQMYVGQELTAVDAATSQSTMLGPIDAPDAMLPIATGSTPFRGLWRTNDVLKEQPLPSTGVATIVDAMAYGASGGTGAGFDAVADDEANSTSYAVVYFNNGKLWFAHRCD